VTTYDDSCHCRYTEQTPIGLLGDGDERGDGARCPSTITVVGDTRGEESAQVEIG
jgi:hypothetical protein